MKVQKVIFLHVIPSSDLPGRLTDLAKKLSKPLEEIVQDELEQTIEEYFDNPYDTDIGLRIIEGNPTDMILREAESENIDLTVLGMKTGAHNRAVLTNKVVRLSPCSTLILPAGTEPTMNKILVPVDFSRHAKMALQQALDISKRTQANVVCQHVYNIPVHYYPFISSTASMQESKLDEAYEAYRDFLEEFDQTEDEVPCIYSKYENRDISELIYHVATEEQADMIVMGAKGKSNTASSLIGGTVEELIAKDKTIPLLIFRDRDENEGLLETLFNW